MKMWLYALGMCQSMFCALPFPWHGWEEKARHKMLLCLPVIGLEIGLLWWAAALLCRWLGLPELLTGAVLTALPGLLTGWMHLDGFMDVTDAVRSYRSLERRREILKDSHVGSFAVIAVVSLLMVQFAAAASFGENAALHALILIPVVSRCCSVLAILCLPAMSTSQYAQVAHKTLILPGSMLAAALVLAFFRSTACGVVLLCTVAGFGLALRRAYASLQGMNGDISGYCICIAELAGMLAIALH